MKVLILGGMGIIGGAITSAAAMRKMDVFVLSRRELSQEYREKGVAGIKGDWKDEIFARNTVEQGFDVIVDTLVFSKQEIIRDLDIVNHHCKQFIYISTDAVYLHPDENVSENQEIDISKLSWSYGYQKREAEKYLMENSAQYDFAWTIIRPTITYGDTRIPVGFASRKNEYTLIKRIMEGKPVLLFNHPASRHAVCHTDVFGLATTYLFLNTVAYEQCFHISDDQSITYEDVFQAISDELGVRAVLIHVSADSLKCVNRAKHDEMIYDKNPVFTLDNSKIKSVSPTAEYHVPIKKAMHSAITYLTDKFKDAPEDYEYNIISDLILLRCKKYHLSSEEQNAAEKYIQTISRKRKDEIYTYYYKSLIQYYIHFAKSVLKCIIRR